MDIFAKLNAIRQSMDQHGIDALIIPRADEYLGEYVPEHNERLRWLSGFTGSAGMAVVLPDRAAVFVDGRYTIQVQRQVSTELFECHHLIDEPPVQWLLANTDKPKIGIDSRLHTWRWYQDTLERCQKVHATLTTLSSNLVDDNWHDRPVPTSKPAIMLSEKYTGEASHSKRQRIGKAIARQGADSALITQLDSIAWLLNIRGYDVPRLPVIAGTALLNADGHMTLFTDPNKLPAELDDHVGHDVTITPEINLPQMLGGLAGSNILADPETTNAHTHLLCLETGVHLIAGENPVQLPKAQKNAVELNGMRACHIRDGVAVTRFLAWLHREVSQGHLHDEAVLANQLLQYRKQNGDLFDLSFDTISAAGANSAICHYNHQDGIPVTLSMNSLYLVDSGGQYHDGTTDITRTVAIGQPTEEQRRMFTLVLKGHIALGQAVFPKGTTGVQLDVLARQYLWQSGKDYDHGTGHGVGSFLSVHEGPQGIGKHGRMVALLPGMVVSNEPGYYKEGDYGIRCENLMAVCEKGNGMLGFETITFAPFDLTLIDPSIMSDSEIIWLNHYHQQVESKLSDLLDQDDRRWLETTTTPVSLNQHPV